MKYDLNSNLFIVYEIKVNGEWKEVTKKEWIQEERSAGFKPKGVTDYWQSMNTCATGGFSGYNREGSKLSDSYHPMNGAVQQKKLVLSGTMQT